MSFKIQGCYCEKLNINQYLSSIKEGTTININVDFKTKLHQRDENSFIFKIFYLLESDSTPISLNWIGVVMIETDEENMELDKDKLLENENIKNFIDASISQLPFFFQGTLPTFDMIKENIK